MNVTASSLCLLLSWAPSPGSATAGQGDAAAPSEPGGQGNPGDAGQPNEPGAEPAPDESTDELAPSDPGAEPAGEAGPDTATASDASAAIEPAAPAPAPVEQPEPKSDDDDDAPASDDDDGDEPRSARAQGEQDEQDEAGDKQKKKDKKLKVKIGARVVAGAGLRYEAAARDLDGVVIGQVQRRGMIDLRQARASIDVRFREILRVRMSLDLADLLGSPSSGDVIRDAWANVEVRPAFQIKVGNFKRPYSRFELRGVSKIPVIGRGLFNGYSVEDLSWGDRAVGVQLWGKYEPERRGLDSIGWAVSASNDALSGAPHGVDIHARLTYDPARWLSIGVSGAFKSVQDALAIEPTCRSEWLRAAECRREVFAAGADVAVKVAGLYAAVEADLAQDWQYADTSPWTLGTLVYATYDFEVAKRTKLQPVLSGEYVDSNMSFAQSEALRGVAGLNILWTKHLRILPQAQLVMPLGTVTAFNPFVHTWIVGAWISVQL